VYRSGHFRKLQKQPWHSAPGTGSDRPLRPANSISGTSTVTGSSLVEEFIAEFEGADLTRWSSFTDLRGIEKEMLSRLDAFFENWLNP
jgi:hypothetical protein